MADDDATIGQDDELEALEEAVSADDADDVGDGEGLDPLAEEMMKMMEEEGDGTSAQGDVDSMMEMEMYKAMEEEGGTAGAEAGASTAVAGADGGEGIPANIRRLMDVSMTVSIELGRSRSTLEAVMDLGEQSVVELDKTVGDPVDVLVNGKLFARGEVVTISENFGVRITELLSAPGGGPR